jgi:hypothetical protein
MSVQVASSTPGEDATTFMADAHEQLVELETQLCERWSAHLAVDPVVADQIAVAARYVRKAAAALADQRLA